MIRAVVIDDEKLVRKGFISLFDWEAHGIAIVGEAGDGKAALELLAEIGADLLFTDITMPGMSGFELMKQVRQRYPRIQSVVLTCHHEFDFVQEALRLGAIDYIVKTLLEMERADETMARIVERYQWEEGCRLGHAADEEEWMASSTAYIFYPAVPEAESGELFRLSVVRRNCLYERNRIGLLPLIHLPDSDSFLKEASAYLGSRWRIARLMDVPNLLLKTLQQQLEERLPITFFYAASTGVPLQLNYGEWTRMKKRDQGAADTILNEASSLRWTMHPSEWEKLDQQAVQELISPEAWRKFGSSLCSKWAGLLVLDSDMAVLEAELALNRNWGDWKRWLRGFAARVQERMMELSLTKEVMACLIRAIVYMREFAGDKINQADVAEYANMSRSYFSQCFAKLAGESFGTVLRGMRIERAKTLLRDTLLPVYEVAARAGFDDDKYFSKLFRELVGVLPSEYRMALGKSV